MYADAGYDGIKVENMWDAPYTNRTCGPEITAAVTMATKRVVDAAPECKVGAQIVAGCSEETLAAAFTAGAHFIRSECLVFSHIADEGLINANGAELMRYRKHMGMEDVQIFTDIQKKHSSHAITADLPLKEWAHNAEYALADGIIVTGSGNAQQTNADHIEQAKEGVTKIPVIVGSGVTPDTLEHVWQADGFIVGSWLKKDHFWQNDLSQDNVQALKNRFDALMEKSFG